MAWGMPNNVKFVYFIHTYIHTYIHIYKHNLRLKTQRKAHELMMLEIMNMLQISMTDNNSEIRWDTEKICFPNLMTTEVSE